MESGQYRRSPPYLHFIDCLHFIFSWFAGVVDLWDLIKHIASADPFADPAIDPHSFEEIIGERSSRGTSSQNPSLSYTVSYFRVIPILDKDLQAFIELIRFTRGLRHVSPWKELVGARYTSIYRCTGKEVLMTPYLVREVNPGPKVQTDEEIGGNLL